MERSEKEEQQSEAAHLEMQKEWHDSRFEIIDRLNTHLLNEVRKDTPKPDAVSKFTVARTVLFNELLLLSDRAANADLMNAYEMKGGHA